MTEQTQAVGSDELFAGFDESGFTRLPFLSDGDYDLTVIGITAGKGYTSNQPYFKVNVQVDSSVGPEALAPGSQATIRFEKSANPKLSKMYLRDVRALMAAILGVSEDTVSKKDLDRVLAPDNIAGGTKFRARRAFFETAEGGVSKWTKFVSAGSAFPPSVAPPDEDAAPKKKRK